MSKSNESSTSIKCREILDWLTKSSATDCVGSSVHPITDLNYTKRKRVRCFERVLKYIYIRQSVFTYIHKQYNDTLCDVTLNCTAVWREVVQVGKQKLLSTRSKVSKSVFSALK